MNDKCKRTDCIYRTKRLLFFGCQFADLEGKTKLGICKARGEEYHIENCPFYASNTDKEKAALRKRYQRQRSAILTPEDWGKIL